MPNYTTDNEMTYDVSLHMYNLGTDTVLELLQSHEETMPEVEVRSMLKMIRNDFYSECLEYAIYRDKYLYYLSLDQNRPYIKEAMLMMFEDILINRSTPGLAFSNSDYISLATPRTRKYMFAMKLLLKQGLAENPHYHEHVKGVDW